jgi:LPS export ABC transporter protein LptC
MCSGAGTGIHRRSRRCESRTAKVRDRVASVIAIVLLTLVAATSYWYSRALRSDGQGSEASRARVDADADQITLVQFDEVGRAKYKLFADRMTHFAETDDVELIKPHLVSLRPDQPRVEAVARRAHVENNGERVRLSGDVVLTRDSRGGQPALRGKTETLLVLPDLDRYLTDQPVLVERGPDSIRARGMDLDNIAQRIEFSSEVVDTITPQHR